MARSGKKSAAANQAAPSEVTASSGVTAQPAPAPVQAIFPGRLSRRVRAGLVLSIYILTLLAFLTVPTFEMVFPDGKAPRMIGPDAYFHLRQVKAVVANYPVVARMDYRAHFPDGERGLNQGFFDVAVATPVVLSGGAISAEVALAWVSPLCLALVGVLGYLWVYKRCDEMCASLYLLLLLLYAGPLKAIAAMGHGDHHAAEVLLALLVAMALDWLLTPSTPWWGGAAAVVPLFVFYLSWAGAGLHLSVVGALFYLRAWLPPAQERDPFLARKGALYGATLLVLVAIVSAVAPWAVIFETSQTVFAGAALALTLGYPPLVWVARRATRYRALLAFGIAATALLALYQTPTGHGGLQELFTPRTRQIAEHTPVSVPLLCSWFGLVWLLALGGLLRVWQQKAFWRSLIPAGYGLLLVLAWVQTYDFNYYTPPILAASAAYALCALPRGRNFLGLIVVLVVMPLIPGVLDPPWVERKVVRDIILYSDGLEAASLYLKSLSPPNVPDQDRPFGLLAPWDLGNILAETADMPVGFSETASGELAQMVYSDQPDEVYEKLLKGRKKPFRYILLPARNLGEKFLGEMMAANLSVADMFTRGDKVEWKGKQITLLAPTPRNRKALLTRLYWDDGQDLGHYREIYETAQQTIQVQKVLTNGQLEFYAWPVTPESLLNLRPLLDNPRIVQDTSRGPVSQGRQAAEVRLFEIVPGVTVSGKTAPLSKILARLDLYAPTSHRSWTCSWSTRADESGHFQLRLPYSTGSPLNSNPDTVNVRGPYRLEVGGQEMLFKVREEDVQSGADLPLP